MEIKHTYPYYETVEARLAALQEINADLSVKLYNKRKQDVEKIQKKKGGSFDDNRNQKI